MTSCKSASCSQRLSTVNSKLAKSSEIASAWLLLYSCMLVILFLRRPDSLINATPWAEDGPIFLQQAIEHSYLSLATLYAGYLHTVPRLVTLFAIQFGLKDAPFVMNLFALIIATISISHIFSKDFRFLIRNDALRFITAIFIICMPMPEIFLNITNIQWPLLIYLILWTTNLIFGSGSTGPAKTTFALLGFLTCPASVILLPAVAWFIYTSRSIPVLAIFSISVLSNLFYLAAGSVAGQGYPNPICIIRFISAQIFTFIHASNLVAQYGYNITCVITGATFIILIYYARDDWAVDAWLWYLIVSYALLIAITRISYINDIDTMWEATRYSFIPLCLLLIICFRHAHGRNYLIYVIIFMFIINIASNYSIAPFQDFDYQLNAEKFNASGECNCTIPINPPGWSFTVPCACTSLDASSWFNRGFILDYQGRYDEAINAYDEAIKLDPNYAKAWNSKGTILGKQGKFDEAIKCFDEAIRLDPNDAEAWYRKGVTLDKQGNYSDAIMAYDEAIRIDPNDAEAWNNKGTVLGKQGKFEQAIQCFDKAIGIDPRDALAWKNEGNVLMVLGRTKEADAAFARSKELGSAV